MKKQDLVKLAVLGMMSVGAAIGAQQPQPQPGPNDTTNYDGSKGICTDPVSNYSSSDKSPNAGKPVPQGQKPAQTQQAAAKAWNSDGAGTSCKTHGGCTSLASCKGKGSSLASCSSCTGYSGCKGSDVDQACGGEAGCGSNNASSNNSAKMQAKRTLR